MLGDAIQQCPDRVWASTGHKNAFWHIACHTLFFTHFYLGPGEAAFRPWKHHQSGVQHEDGVAGRPEPGSSLPLLPLHESACWITGSSALAFVESVIPLSRE